MKTQITWFVLFAAMLTTFTGCEVIGGIFKAGVGVGVFAVILVIAIIIFLVSKAGKK